MRIAITGYAGYLGSALISTLAKRESTTLVGYDTLTFTHLNTDQLALNDSVALIKGDILDKPAMLSAFANCDIIVHMAALVGDKYCSLHPELAERVNVEGTRNVIEVAAELGIEKIIFMSTCSVYGAAKTEGLLTEKSPFNPVSLYAETKIAAEKEIHRLCEQYQISTTILRLGTVFGLSPFTRFDLLINSVASDIAHGRPVELYGVDSYRPYISVSNIVDIISHVIDHPTLYPGVEVFNAGFTENNFTKRDLKDLIADQCKKAGTSAEVILVPKTKDRRSYQVDFSALAEKHQGSIDVMHPITGLNNVIEAVSAGRIQPAFISADRTQRGHGDSPTSATPKAIPWSTPWLNGSEAAGVAQSFDTTWLSTGPKVKAFEAEMAALVGSKYALAVNNGTSALELSLQAKGIGPGDTVAVPAFTYFATVSAVVRIGATPIFIDSEAHSFNLCPKDLAAKITPTTKAVIYIDYGAFPANYEAIKKVARNAGLAIIHDAAQSLGTTRNGRSIVSEGDISTTSFHAAKLMTTVEGGMVFCNDDALYTTIQKLRNQGEAPGEKYLHTAFGTNARMTDIQAAIGLAQLSRLSAIIEKRQAIAETYTQMLQGIEGITVQQPSTFKNSSLAWMFYPIMVEHRDAIAQDLKSVGIDTRIAYARPTHRQPCVQAKYPGLQASSPRAEYICAHVLNLPMFHEMTLAQQQRVSDAVKTAVEKYRSASIQPAHSHASGMDERAPEKRTLIEEKRVAVSASR